MTHHQKLLQSAQEAGGYRCFKCDRAHRDSHAWCQECRDRVNATFYEEPRVNDDDIIAELMEPCHDEDSIDAVVHLAELWLTDADTLFGVLCVGLA